jgi:hypothetical protein
MRIVSLDSEVTFSSHFLETSPVDQTIIGQVTEKRTFQALRKITSGLPVNDSEVLWQHKLCLLKRLSASWWTNAENYN